MKLRTIFGLVAILGVLGFATMGACDDASTKTAPAAAEAGASAPVAFLPEKIFEFKPTLGGKEVVHDFVVQNKGDALLKIEKVKTA